MTPRRPPRSADPTSWSRERLLLLVVAGALGAVFMLVGLGWGATYAVQSLTTPTPLRTLSAGPGAGDAQGRRDAIAAAPMRQLTRQEMLDATPALQPPPVIRVPEPFLLRGPAGVPWGFPQTPEGAVGQLAAIDRHVLETMSLPEAAAVHQQWSLPGAVSFGDWVMARSLQSFLGTAGQGTTKDAATSVTAVPVAALVKGTDGADWVLGCVLYDVRATIRVEARLGFGHCERLQWADGRWQIGPGPQPFFAPSAWPGSQVAHDSGWLTWVTQG